MHGHTHIFVYYEWEKLYFVFLDNCMLPNMILSSSFVREFGNFFCTNARYQIRLLMMVKIYNFLFRIQLQILELNLKQLISERVHILYTFHNFNTGIKQSMIVRVYVLFLLYTRDHTFSTSRCSSLCLVIEQLRSESAHIWFYCTITCWEFDSSS